MLRCELPEGHGYCPVVHCIECAGMSAPPESVWRCPEHAAGGR
eukprot:CAMPEP_0175890066 /NCGR_PEP_ID=MMETSP0107_2-20121207/47620_1 /TAXON_ID=195067 ORGANISM="Goniomonas pacifica, Strain CCMP1869" /NCGR_SAMPLE_ID=MMETSP0107_2 /ASSEMBLY_ACC=CAM_ASM_000203 /LENGTH=42 /DNA_ID= /DNA_START= /DNA_END= /DNA_ORIENTATION=